MNLGTSCVKKQVNSLERYEVSYVRSLLEEASIGQKDNLSTDKDTNWNELTHSKYVEIHDFRIILFKNYLIISFGEGCLGNPFITLKTGK